MWLREPKLGLRKVYGPGSSLLASNKEQLDLAQTDGSGGGLTLPETPEAESVCDGSSGGRGLSQ